MTTFDELKAYIGHRFPCVAGNASRLCQTGDRYEIIGEERLSCLPGDQPVTGIIRDGQEPEWFYTEKEAIAAAKNALEIYAKGKTGTLYWRMEPQMRTIHRVYMRLVITDKPVIQETDHGQAA